MQYKLDTTANTKIPGNLVHKFPFECFRNQFQCLERLWFNFKITVFLHNFRWYPSQPFWPADWSLTGEWQCCILQIMINHQKNNNTVLNCDESSEWPDNKPQILQIFLRKCQLFKVLWQRPQDQRPNSNTFSG